MKKLIFALLLVLGLSFGAFAQNTNDKVDFYFGYQYLRQNIDTNRKFAFDKSSDLHGVNAAVTGYVSDHVGLTAEGGFNFGTDSRYDSSLLTAMGGLTIKARNNKSVQPFIRGLAGVARERAAVNQLNFDVSDVGFAFAAGGGIDLKVDKNLAIRLIQADYMQTRFNGEPTHNLRIGAGIVF